MSAALPPPAPPSSRLALTVLYALAVHLVLALGLRVAPPRPPAAAAVPRLEITLVQRPAPTKPVPVADSLAERSQDGGGNRPAPAAPAQPVAQAAAQAPARPAPKAAAERPLLTAAKPARAQLSSAPQPEPVAPAPSAAELLRGGRRYAQLEAPLDRPQLAAGGVPREKVISARTREYKYAAYMEAWRRKVEAVGNLNYPAEARRQGLSGSLILTVRIAADGSLVDTRLVRSSGQPILDQAAQDIVHWAAPYAPFPPDIRADTDILVITRTWQFLDGRAVAGE